MYQHILAPVDGSETSARALSTALRIARETGAELEPLYVIDVPLMSYTAPGFDPSIVRDAFVEEGDHLREDALAMMQRENVIGTPRVVEVEPLGGDVAQRILQEAEDRRSDLVVMGTHGRRGFRRLVLGSVAERFVRMAPCPVLLVPASVKSATSARTSATPQPE
jgi:nucleotide-binding universal stress UspA family protein